MLTEMGGDAIPALAQAAGEATFDRTVDLATAMLAETDLHERLRARIEAEITDDTRVLVAHSLGTVLSYSALAAHDDWPVHTFVTLGSPLAVPMLFNSLEPAPVDGLGVWPGSVQRWVNVRARERQGVRDLPGRPLRAAGRGARDRQRAPGPCARALPQLFGDRRRHRRRARVTSDDGRGRPPASSGALARRPGPFSRSMAETKLDRRCAPAAAPVPPRHQCRGGPLQRGAGGRHRKRSWRQIKARPRASSSSAWPSLNRREMLPMTTGPPRPRPGLAERFGVSGPTARFSHVGEKAQELPHLVGSLCAGEISFDKVRAVVDVATPESDRELCDQAKELSVRELVEVARRRRPGPVGFSLSPSRSSTTAATCASTTGTAPCRCSCPRGLRPRPRPVSMPGPAGCPLRREGRPWTSAAATASWPWLTRPLRAWRPSAEGPRRIRATAPSPFFVVAHVPLEALVDDAGEKSELAGELEHHGLIDVETVQRIACDATVVVAVDDTLGHTMYEGRARRFPSGPSARGHPPGPTLSVPGLCQRHLHQRPSHRPVETRRWRPIWTIWCFLCKHHHGVVHRNGWSMTGQRQ